MSDVVKKGFLEVKKRNLFGSAYKEKYIILRNSADHKCKVVEIQDSEDGDDTRETVKLNDSWTVQDRPSKSRGKYAFELLMCEEAVLTFGCGTFIEREEWTEAFRILNQLAPAFVGSLPLPTTIMNDYFSVNLIKNRSAMEINHSGPYVLSITTSAIILHWRTMAIAHQWSRRSVTKLYHPRREGRLILNTQRPAGGPPTEFEFVTDDHNALQILKLWNIRLLESIPRTQQQFTDFSSSKSHSVKERRSFRTPKAASRVNDNDLKRAGSFSKMHTLGTGLVGGVLPGRRSWGGSNEIYPPPIPNSSQLSQDSMFSSLTSPPPLPPRPVESDSDEEDPDYAYIDENKVKGPENQRVRSKTLSASGSGRVSSPSLDDQLEELKKSIMRENKKKKRDKAAERKAATLHFVPSRNSPRSRLPLDFPRADPEDYLEPVASKRITSTSSEGVPRRHKDTSGNRLSLNAGESANSMSQSLSDHGVNTNHSSSSSIGTSACEVFDDSQTPPDVHGGGSTAGLLGNPPTLPPRPWRNSTSSVSSATSPSSTVPPSASSGLVSSRTSISEEKMILHEEEEPHKSPSPTVERTNGGSGDQTPEAVPAEATSHGNGRQVALSSSSKDGSMSPIDASSSSTSTSPPPPLPPRSPTRDRERLSRKSSSSSVSSNTSCSRCHRCRPVKKTTKTHVVKTISLDPRGGVQAIQPLTKEESRKSLPDLNNASPVPENSLAHHRHHPSHSASREHHSCSKCSVGSSTSTDGLQPAANSNGSLPSSSSQQNFTTTTTTTTTNEYLQLVSEEGDRKRPKQPEAENDHDVFSSCLQEMQDLQRTIDEIEMTSNSPNLSSKATTATSYNQRTAVQSEFEAAKRRAELVQAELSLAGRSVQRSLTSPDERTRGVANGHPPLLKKQNTSLLASSSSSASSPLTSSSSPGSSGPLHWTQQPQPLNARTRGHTNGTVVRQTSGSSVAGSTPTRVSPPLSLSQQSFHLPAGGPGLGHAAYPVGGASSFGGGAAPPVPPRSQVSLGEVQSRGHPQGHMIGRSFSQVSTRSPPSQMQQQRGLNKTTSLGRHMTSWSHAHPGPQRGMGMSQGMVSGTPPPSSFHNHIEPQSATVFVHHLTRTNSRHRQVHAHLV